jgi:hypothetical protein
MHFKKDSEELKQWIFFAYLQFQCLGGANNNDYEPNRGCSFPFNNSCKNRP